MKNIERLPETGQIIIEEMTVADIEDILIINRMSFPDPWSRSVFEDELLTNDFATYYIMRQGGIAIGYIGLWLVIDDASVTNIAIHPDYRGKQYGEQLFLYALQQAIARGMNRLSLEVRTSNVIAQKLYQKFGLVPGGIRKNYYANNGEDAIVMWVNL